MQTIFHENGVKIFVRELKCNSETTVERRPNEAKYIFVLSGVLSVQREHNSSFKLCKLESMTIPPRNWHSYKTFDSPVKIIEMIYGEQ